MVRHNTKKIEMEIPCKLCSNSIECEVNKLECSAFRKWSNTGLWAYKDVKRLIRTIPLRDIERTSGIQ